MKFSALLLSTAAALSGALVGCRGADLTGPDAAGELAWRPIAVVGIQGLEGASLRGLSVPQDEVVWVSGSNGLVLRSIDGGASWSDVSPTEARRDALDARSLVALDAERAWIATAGPGSASRILKTTNGGRAWTTVRTNREPQGFYNALRMWNGTNGLVMGDAVDGRLTLLRTADGGESWERLGPEGFPRTVEGEVGFAASNRSLALLGARRAWLGTGGAQARVWSTDDRGRTWTATHLPLQQGDEGAGVFALAFRDERHGVAVGGNYTLPDRRGGTAAKTDDGGRSWLRSEVPPGGYRSSVAPAPDRAGLWLAVGINGMDVTWDDGRTWEPIGAGRGIELNAVAFAPSGRFAWAVGPDGRICRLAL